jgi:serine/threonine protein kinase
MPIIFPDGFKLKILDFGVSIKLKLFEKKFIGTHGQENYRAPEMLSD